MLGVKLKGPYWTILTTLHMQMELSYKATNSYMNNCKSTSLGIAAKSDCQNQSNDFPNT